MLDDTDSRLLNALQKDAHLTAQELGERLNLSASQAGRRRQRLEEQGFILGYAARLDRPGSGCMCKVSCRCRWPATRPKPRAPSPNS